jgi:hypothetical protein
MEELAILSRSYVVDNKEGEPSFRNAEKDPPASFANREDGMVVYALISFKLNNNHPNWEIFLSNIVGTLWKNETKEKREGL